MSRWLIEKSGTGIEKSGTGIEKSGTGIEKSGTGIEKSGTGIEKSGTGIRKGFLACSLAALTFAANLNAATNPKGVMTIVVENGSVTASWILGGSAFIGGGELNGASTYFSLMEFSRSAGVVNSDSRSKGNSRLDIAGGGTGEDIAGGGTGEDIAGGGTGEDIAGGGTGDDIAGGGTGDDIAGGGTGDYIAGGGTGDDAAGANTILIAGGGTGDDAYAITLPDGVQMQMEVSLGCATATIYVLDSAGYEITSFENIRYKGTRPEGCSVSGSNNGYARPTARGPREK